MPEALAGMCVVGTDVLRSNGCLCCVAAGMPQDSRSIVSVSRKRMQQKQAESFICEANALWARVAVCAQAEAVAVNACREGYCVHMLYHGQKGAGSFTLVAG